ncbi:D-alanyl-D-alanine carboxypeptidase family protein [Gorillibacterium sp. sgz5001074]|uniref:D-alanyl-D-alanine carboxypeptidase family protein n=1 Tax=Gorillibacterium sp. sgz5001074 TaxID=3446695 RepID=UPI003F669B93
MRKGTLHLLLIAVLLLGLCGGGAPAAAAPERIGTRAEAAALIDVKSGRLLYTQQGDKRMRIASLTKIMTAIVAVEQGRLSDSVKVGSNAYGKEGSSVYLKLGEEMSLHHLLYGLMLRSGNDAATAIAEHVGGSEMGFVYLMNQKAQELGMIGSHFMNPHGLDHDEHYSTANDMAKLTAYALQNPVFQEIVKTEVKKVPNPSENWDRVWTNKNKMLNIYEGSDGVKTGYTKLAKRCLVSSATRNGQQLAVVTLNDPDDWLDHSRLLDWGFKSFTLTPLVKQQDAVENGYVAGRSFSYALEEGEISKIEKKVEWNDKTSTAYRLGEAGRLTVLLDGKPIGAVPVYPAGSPRLSGAQGDAGVNRYTSQAAVVGFREGWADVLGALLRTLFGGGERQG